MKAPCISVIIPSYNYGCYIVEALKSVSAQTFADWECIVVDDGSADNTRTLVEDFISRHTAQQFRYVHISNSGTSVAKNTGIDLARGKYIQFLDADDLLSPDKLAIQAAIIQAHDCALVFSKSVFFRQGAAKDLVEQYPKGFLAETSLQGAALLAALINNNVITISSPLVHKELLIRAGKFQTELKHNEDWLLWFNIALSKPIFLFDGDGRSLSRIRIHGNSAMRVSFNMYLGEVIVRETIDRILRASDGQPDQQALRRLNMDLLALHRVRSMDWRSGWQYILRERRSLVYQGLFRSCVRLFRQLVPNYGT